jgi:hypothetical protein
VVSFWRGREGVVVVVDEVEERRGRTSHTCMVLSDEPEIKTSSWGIHNKDLRKSECASVVDISRAD